MTDQKPEKTLLTAIFLLAMAVRAFVWVVNAILLLGAIGIGVVILRWLSA